MSEKRHILISGDRGAGKSTLIQRLLEKNALPVAGFVTKRLEADGTGFHPIYIHRADPAASRSYAPENLIGVCDSRTHRINPAVFDTLGVRYIGEALPGGLIVMDELGFMEAQSELFTKKVLEALDGDIPVIAAVKTRYDIPFLDEVREHPRAELFAIDESCRDALYEKLLPVIEAWNRQDDRRR